LPGLGPRSARRLVLHLLKNKNKLLLPLNSLLTSTAESIVNCQLCNNLDITSPCAICLDNNRDKSKICVTEDVSDLWAIEKGNFYKGNYHVLGGTLSAIDGVGPDDLSIDALLNRIENDEVEEVILANNATIEGKTTAFYLIDKLKKFKFLKISQLAHGIPMGGEIDYLDEHTLSQAINARNYINNNMDEY
jgi:recombination protein RecR